MTVMISWRGNNHKQQHFDLEERGYINPSIIIIIIIIIITIIQKWFIDRLT